MFVDGSETKFLAPMKQMVIKDEKEAQKILKFYAFVEEIVVKQEIHEEVKPKKKSKKKKKLEAFEG